MYEEYLQYLKRVKKRSEGTLRQYRTVLREFYEFFPINEKRFHEYLDKISTNSPKTQQMKLSVVKNFLEWLYFRGHIDGKRFWKDAEPPRVKTLPHYLTHSELMRFLEVVDDPYYRSLFRLLVNTGLRISEFLSLKVEDVDMLGEVARIRIRGKGNKERVVQVNADVVREAIERGILERKVSARTIQRKMREYAKKAGIRKKVTPHSLRHTFAIILMEKGVPLNRIQALLGHESIATTSIYLKILGEQQSIPKII